MFPVAAQVLGGIDGHHARTLPRRRDVDAIQASVGIVAPQKRHVEHTRYLDVVDEQGPPGEQPRIFGSLDALANHFFCHAFTPLL